MEVSKQIITEEFSKIKLQFYPCHTANLTIMIVFLLPILQKYYQNSPAWIAKMCI